MCLRVLLALPAPLFIEVKTEGGRTMLELNKMIKHVNQHQVSCRLKLFIQIERRRLWFQFFFGFGTEERVFSLWFAVVPSYCSLPKGEDYSLNRTWKQIQTSLPGFSERTQSAACFPALGCVVCQRPLWMPSTRIQQRLVSDPTTLSSAPRLCSGNDRCRYFSPFTRI